MFDYTFGGTLSSSQPIWTRAPLSPLSSTVLTPFSHSILAEILRRGWFNYSLRLGLEPQPGAQLVRQYQGRTYLNLSLPAALEAEAGLELPVLRINGARFPLAETKSSFLVGLFGNRVEKKVLSTLAELVKEAASARQNAREWLQNVKSLKWTQAEILQVMEQIERVGTDSMMLFFAARYNLELGLNQILWALERDVSFPQSLGYASALFAGLGNAHLSNLIETDISSTVLELAQLARNDQVSTPAGQPLSAWSEWLPHGKFKTALTDFLDAYGHRCVQEGELRNPRWREDGGLPVSCILVLAQREATPTGAGAQHKSGADLLEKVDAKDRKAVGAWLERFPQLLHLQSQALDGFAYVLAGSRLWIEAAAREAMADERLHSAEEAFYFELEELKEMMTGEWNVSSTQEIRARLAERQAEYSRWEKSSPAPLLVGNQEANATRAGLPTAADLGLESAAFTDLTNVEVTDLTSALVRANPAVRVPVLDSGGSALLPLANSFVAGRSHLLDPAVAAALSRQKVVVGEE